MSVKQVSGGLVVEDFAGHGVYEGCGFVTVLLCDLCHALAFGEVAANDTVIALIAATFAGGKGMAVVDRQALVTLLIMLHKHEKIHKYYEHSQYQKWHNRLKQKQNESRKDNHPCSNQHKEM